MKLRLGTSSTGVLTVKAGELSPRALRQKLREQLLAYKGHPTAKPHLGLHEVELVLAKDKLETMRIANDLAEKTPAVIDALRLASDRTDAAW